jgi:polyisoprenyl-phosphate glycosyltransferase
MKLSVVIPVYNEERNIGEFIARVRPILAPITPDFELIFAMDPSTDKTEEVICRENLKDPRIKLLKFSRRFGQPAATFAGLVHSTGDAVVVIDVDLQDPPELITKMVAEWQNGFDVVYAQRISRAGDTWPKRLISYAGYKLINRIAEVNIPPNTGDYRLMSRRVVNEVVKLKESHGFLRGMVALVGFRQTSIPFERPVRFAGVGNYNRFFGSIRIGMNGVICFSNYLLTLSTASGFFCAALAFLMAIVYMVMKIRGASFPLGNPTIVILVLFMGGVQLISIGVVGEYIGRIYEEVRQRPRFIVESAVGFEPDSVTSPIAGHKNGPL